MLQRFLSPRPFSPRLNHKAHVLFVTPGFASDEADTECIPPVQVMLRRLAECLPGLHVSVISLHYPKARQPYEWHGFGVVPLGGNNRPWPLRLMTLGRGLTAARRLHADRPVDVVHGLWLTDATLLGGLIAHRLELPMAATIMGQDALRSNRYLRRLPLSGMRIAAASDRAADALRGAVGKQVDAVIPWGLNTPATGESSPWSERPIHLLGVGSLTENKDFELLFRLCRRLRDSGRSCRAALIGDGPQRAALETEAKRLELGSSLIFEGHQPRPEVLRRMAGTRILVHPARYEGFGFVFSEALACGMSVVSRPVGAAAASPRWRICASEEQFFTACIELLDGPPDTAPVELWPEESTVQEYSRLWGLTGEPKA